jgi:hypothetical protein
LHKTQVNPLEKSTPWSRDINAPKEYQREWPFIL